MSRKQIVSVTYKRHDLSTSSNHLTLALHADYTLVTSPLLCLLSLRTICFDEECLRAGTLLLVPSTEYEDLPVVDWANQALGKCR